MWERGDERLMVASIRRRGWWASLALLSGVLFVFVTATSAAALLGDPVAVPDPVEETVEAIVEGTSDTVRGTTQPVRDAVHPPREEPLVGAEVTDPLAAIDGQPAPRPPADASPSVSAAPATSPEQAPVRTVPDASANPATMQPSADALARPNTTPPLASAPDEEAADLKAIAQGAVFPLGLVLLVVTFLAVQDHIDRRDPKLALAPVQASPDLAFPAPTDRKGG